ncbi:MAG TPA: hypothetical protein VFC44_15680 [Candidatus Saccharimonadales bacterium]|nr:hypothetical protein [Candidatus Saccharimonadales bacterium]
MKSWIKKFQILADLDDQLKNAQPQNAPPDDLHESIMRRVRSAARKMDTRTARSSRRWRWLTAPGLVLVGLLGLWLGSPEKNSPAPALSSDESARSLVASGSVIEMTHSIIQNAPATALAPMEREIALLRNDGRRAMSLALSSLPLDALARVEPAGNRPPL